MTFIFRCRDCHRISEEPTQVLPMRRSASYRSNRVDDNNDRHRTIEYAALA